MQCDVARKQLYLQQWPPEYDAEGSVFQISADVTQAKAHLTHCDACRRFFAAEERLRVFLQTRAPREKASAALREGVLARIAQERKRSTGNSGRGARWFGLLRHQRLILGLSTLLALSVIASGLWLIERRAGVKTQEIASILIDDHAHSLPVVTEIASSDTGVVQTWFQERLGFAFHLPPLRDPSLLGGRLCNLQGRRAALVLYRHPQSKVSLFILDGSDVELPEARLIALDGKRCLVDTRKGYNAVLWKERGLLYGLVSDLRSAELLQLAEQF